MKIKRIEIIGFKSFVDKVSLDFQDGVAAILGPNGCGKSNIVDAIRWVMGEQNAKNLRGRSMEDVIFGGSESRKPLGMAEVSILFSNEDRQAPGIFREVPEIVVSRRLHRSGESEYLLNKTPCRLLDITELFMDTGVGARAYSIIEQGKIGMILNAKPEDRRSLIEEAAGVTKFKSRKKSALRKIEATRQNLLRLSDIVSEVRRQLGSLKRQAQKAQRFRELREELKEIEIGLARDKFQELTARGAAIGEREADRRQALEGLSTRLQQGEMSLEEMRLKHAEKEKEVARDQERIFHFTAEIQRVEGKIDLGSRERDSWSQQRERLAAEKAEIVTRLAGFEQEQAELEANRIILRTEMEQENRSMAEGEALLEEGAAREQELAARLEEARSNLYDLLTEISRFGSRQEEAQRRLQAQGERAGRNRSETISVREQMEEARVLLEGLEAGLREFRESHAELRQEHASLSEKLLVLRRELEENEEALLSTREEFSRHRSRLESLRQFEQTLEGYGRGVRSLLGDAAFRQRFGGPLTEFLEVPPPLEMAVEAVLGERLQALPAAPADLGPAMEFLRQQDGRCTFLLPDFGFPEPTSPAGGRPLLSLVQAKAGREAFIHSLLSGIFLVDSIEPFLTGNLAVGTVLVTPAGEVLTFRGEVTGGGRQGLDRGLLHQKREMKDLADRVEVLGRQMEQLQSRREEMRAEITATEESVREVEAAVHRQELKVVDCNKDRDRLHQELARLQERLEVLSFEEDQLHDEENELQEQLQGAARGREERELHKSELEASVARLQGEVQVLRRETDVVRERVTSLKVKAAGIREREEGSRRSLERIGQLRQELQGRLALVAAREEEGEEQQERSQIEGERLRTELEILFRRREEEKGRSDCRRDEFEAAAFKMAEQEAALKDLRSTLGEIREELAEVQLQGREVELETDHLRQFIQERYRLDLAEDSEKSESLAPEAAERRLSELRRRIDDMGEVNLTAIDEYRELEERHGFLTVQQEDLKQSLEGLQAAIAKINRTTRRRFRETFDQVNARFREVFPRLFRGGQAELRLTDEEDLLETGIDIVVQPPGKKLQNVNLLSGGEKALTAVALIFSIFLIKPSPFCILDEVDAPLDDANIGRFNEMVREMAEKSQFIIITHNRRTMEVADTLYGVTMEEPGISKIVSVRMREYAA